MFKTYLFNQNTSQGELYFTMWLAPRSVRMKQVLSQAGKMRLSQEWGCLTALMEKKFPKFEEWYPNSNDIVAFFFISGKKSGENLHEHTFMHHDHHPISIVFPLQLPNTIFILWFSLYRNKQIFITFLPPPLPSHVYWSVNTKQKREPFYFESFQKLKKRNLEPGLPGL